MDKRVTLLEVNQLEVDFSGSDKQMIHALKGVSFNVEQGEIIAIVGESGSGKSVTSLSIMGLLSDNAHVKQGSILFSSKDQKTVDLLSLTAEQLQEMQGDQISMIFQEPMTSLNPVLTVADQLTETMIAHQNKTPQEAYKIAVELLERVHISEPQRVMASYPAVLSGGMRQRVMIAMALSCQPRLLIADEPTTALDVTVQAKILEIICEQQKQLGMSVIFITHDMGVVAEIADRVIVMNQGAIVETGSVYDIFNQPQQDYTKALLAAVPKLGSMEGKEWPQKFDLVGENIAHKPHQTANYDAEPILEISNLTTRFVVKKSFFGRPLKQVHAVEHVNLKIWPGETLALVGESGCGKSTTGRAIIRLVQSVEGDISIDSQPLHHLNEAEFKAHRKSIQMVFQDPYASLNPRLTVGFSIAEPLVTHGIVKNIKEALPIVKKLLLQVGLQEGYANRYPHEFSGGQRQRIAIARALAINPKIIIADEAVSALDVSIQAQVINLMMDLQKEFNISWLFISHDMAVVERIANRVAVMYLGQIVEIGPRDAIFNQPQHPYTKRLLSSVPIANPMARHKRTLSDLEIPSAIKNVGDAIKLATYQEVSEQHWVAQQNFGII